MTRVIIAELIADRVMWRFGTNFHLIVVIALFWWYATDKYHIFQCVLKRLGGKAASMIHFIPPCFCVNLISTHVAAYTTAQVVQTFISMVSKKSISIFLASILVNWLHELLHFQNQRRTAELLVSLYHLVNRSKKEYLKNVPVKVN